MSPRSGMLWLKLHKNVNISVEYQWFYMKPSEQGSFFWAGWNESKEWYAMIKPYKIINISVEYQLFCMKPSEQGLLFQGSQNKSKEWYATIETYKNVNISVEYQQFCTKPSEQGSFFQTGWNESKEWYAKIKTSQKCKYLSGISTGSAWNLQNRAHFSELVKMSPRSGMLQSKLIKM